MSGFSNSILGGMSKLIRAAIQSPNYAAGSAGWSINKDGSAEFNDVTIRGQLVGAIAFYYSTDPGAYGSLTASVAGASGIDQYGNAYLPGHTSYYESAGTWFACSVVGAAVAFYTATSPAGPWTGSGNISGGTDLTLTPNGDVVVQSGKLNAEGGALIQNGMDVPDVAANFFLADAYDPVAGYPTVETWHNLGSPSVSGLTLYKARYRMSPLGGVEFDLAGLWTGGSGFNSNFPNTLPAAYQPTDIRTYPVGLNTTLTSTSNNWPGIEINGGTVSLRLPPGASGVHIAANFMMYLD